MSANHLSEADRADLVSAYDLLENPSFAARLTNVIGQPLEKAIKYLPEGFTDIVNRATRKTMERALILLTSGMKGKASPLKTNRRNRIMAGISGGLGGAFGIAGLAVELPTSTLIMLRSIADIARQNGENLHHPDTQLACLEVFALGGRTSDDDAAETGYFGVRIALANAVSEAASHIARHGAAAAGGPVLVRVIQAVAARFGVIVTQKAAAQAIPVVGAAAGASVNLLFTAHFQQMALGHFTVRKLERKYSPEIIRQAYEEIGKYR